MARLGFTSGNVVIHSKSFGCSTGIEEAGGFADVVLLGHSLYGTQFKEGMVDHAIKFVAPGGILLIFHRWVDGGAVDCLCKHLTTKKMMYDLKVFDIKMDLALLHADERRILSRYTAGDVSNHDDRSTVTRSVGCIAIEPLSSPYGDDQRIADSREKVAYLARAKVPALIVVPNSTVEPCCVRSYGRAPSCRERERLVCLSRRRFKCWCCFGN